MTLRKILFFPAILAASLFLSCSLKYNDEETKVSANTPEFIFTQADFYRYKKDKKNTEVHAQILEQYKNNQSYAKDFSFTTWDSEQNIETRGSCLLLSMDSNKDVYTLVTDIFIENLEQNITLKAQNLKWNGKTEQLTSGVEDIVFLTKDDIQMQGTGFSASGISRQFNFSGNVSGTLISQPDEDQPEQEALDE